MTSNDRELLRLATFVEEKILSELKWGGIDEGNI
jgi:hypothetical protein